MTRKIKHWLKKTANKFVICTICCYRPTDQFEYNEIDDNNLYKRDFIQAFKGSLRG